MKTITLQVPRDRELPVGYLQAIRGDYGEWEEWVVWSCAGETVTLRPNRWYWRWLSLFQ